MQTAAVDVGHHDEVLQFSMLIQRLTERENAEHIRMLQTRCRASFVLQFLRCVGPEQFHRRLFDCHIPME